MNNSKTKMDSRDFKIGAYYLKPYANTERHVKEVKECGIDFITSMQNDQKVLDIFEKYDLGAVVVDVLPRWWGGDGSGAGKMEETFPIEHYIEAFKNVVDRPCVWGIDICDEPSALDLHYLGKVIDIVNREFPQIKSYINLYPMYAVGAQNTADDIYSQLGTDTYEEHIDCYCKNIDIDYICYDFYQYSVGVARAYENLRVVSDAARKTGREMWIVLQVNSQNENFLVSENMLRHQAFTAMAFGVKNIIWACYTAGWWHHQVLDDKGEKTEQYDKLKKVNAEIHHFGNYYKDFKTVSTYFVGFDKNDEDLSKLKQEPIPSLDTGVFVGLHGDETAKLVVGQMVSRDEDGKVALMISNSGDYKDEHKDIVSKVTFKSCRKVKLITTEDEQVLTPNENGVYSFDLPMSKAAMIIAE